VEKIEMDFCIVLQIKNLKMAEQLNNTPTTPATPATPATNKTNGPPPAPKKPEGQRVPRTFPNGSPAQRRLNFEDEKYPTTDVVVTPTNPLPGIPVE